MILNKQQEDNEMGFKFDRTNRMQINNQNELRKEDINVVDQTSGEGIFDKIRRNWRFIVIFIFIIIIILILMNLVGDQLQQTSLQLLEKYKNVTFVGFMILVGIGGVMVIVGAPILFFELALGCILNSYFIAVTIVSSSKLFGILVSYHISTRFFKLYILQKFRDNIYLKAIHFMSKRQPAKAMSILAIIQIPMLLKNYSLPLFDIHLKYIIFVFCAIQVLQSALFVFIGSTFKDKADGQNQNNFLKDSFTYLSYAFTVGVFFFIYRQTQKLKLQASLISDSLPERRDSQILKISYQDTQSLQDLHIQINQVVPEIHETQ